jgi:Na+-translocating ferredoxin:NAD+ oxidoreductase subunit B
MTIILLTFCFSVLLALVLGVALGFFKEKFAIARDPMIDKVRAALPSVNCGACGYPGCDAYAEAVAARKADVNLCTSGGKHTADALAELLGVKTVAEDDVAVLLCPGKIGSANDKGDYLGVKTCRAAKLATGGVKMCLWGCQGFGDCERVCMFDALHMGPDGLPHIDHEKCTGCGLCVAECPQRILAKAPKDRVGAVTLCSNRNPIKPQILKTCDVGCIKCELCVKSCPKGAIHMENGIPLVDYALCDSCGVCVEKCPTNSFKLFEKDVFAKA